MATVTVYGSSDDLIEVDGDLSEEFYALAEGEYVLSFSDGTMLGVRYDNEGMWRIRQIASGGSVYSHRGATDPDDDYSDRVTLVGNLSWVTCQKVAL